VNNPDNLLTRIESSPRLVAQRALAHSVQEIPDNLVMYVRVQKREADLPQGRIHVGLAQPAAPAEAP